MFRINLKKVRLAITFIFKDKCETVNIDFGEYQGKAFDCLIITDGKSFLVNDEDFLLLRSGFDALCIDFKSSVDLLFDHFKNRDIYLYGVEALKPEQYKEALAILLKF